MKKVQAPASKSISHRAVIGSALAPGISTVSHVLESKDLERTMAILGGAGAVFERVAPGEYRVTGVSGKPQGGTVEALGCDVHESGTTCRLLTAVLAAGHGMFRIHGAPRMHERPIGELTMALEKLGVTFSFEDKSGFPPMKMDTKGLNGGCIEIGMDESSQYLSGLLLAAPMAVAPLTITLGGKKAVSWPYVGLTLDALEMFGIPFAVEGRKTEDAGWEPLKWRTINEARPGLVRFCMQPAAYTPGSYAVEGDWSGASYLLAAGAIGREPVHVGGLKGTSLQGDRAIIDILQDMGARVAVDDTGVTVFPSSLHGITVDMNRCPDLVPTVAVVAAFAEGQTTITNVAHLKIKESDRIAAPAQELARVGVTSERHADGLTVNGQGEAFKEALAGKLGNINFSAHGDHRIAMSTALLELYGGRITLDDPGCVRKSFPNFWTVWEQIR